MTDKRRKLADKIRGLLAKTTENGATEQEALSAAALAAKLMAENDIAVVDLAEVDEEAIAMDRRAYAKRTHVVSICSPGIAKLTRTQDGYYSDGSILYIGPRSRTEIAHALTLMLRNAIDSAWAAHAKTLSKGELELEKMMARIQDKESPRSAYRKLMAMRIQNRLITFAEESETRVSATETGRALIVQELQALQRGMEQLGIKIERGGAPRLDKLVSDAGRAGWEAGGKVGLGGLSSGSGGAPALAITDQRKV